MPSVPTVAAKSIRPIQLTDKLAEHYSFVHDRFEGEDGYYDAFVVCTYFRQQGWRSGIHTDTTSTWEKGRSVQKPYYKVWLGHKEESLFYTWWTPTKDSFCSEPDHTLATWFEFVDPKKKDDKK